MSNSKTAETAPKAETATATEWLVDFESADGNVRRTVEVRREREISEEEAIAEGKAEMRKQGIFFAGEHVTITTRRWLK